MYSCGRAVLSSEISRSVSTQGAYCPAGFYCVGGSNDMEAFVFDCNMIAEQCGGQWDHTASPAYDGQSAGVPAWNQSQYKHCLPGFQAWEDMRRRHESGSLVAKVGGLGRLMVPNQYESWVCMCVLDD